MPEAMQPVSAAERIRSLDTLRGVAVLGILLMNIVGFGFYPAVYSDPTLQGGAQGLNLWVYMFNLFLVDGKMRGLFTLLFGAGVVLFTVRWESRGAGVEVADLYCRRMLWLALFGIAHAFLLWWGEILFPYALMGLILFPFRRLSVKALIWIPSVMTLLMFAGMVFDAYDTGKTKAKAEQAQALKKTGTKLTEEQEKALASWDEKLKQMKPDAAALRKNHELNTKNPWTMIQVRAEMAMYFHRTPVYSPLYWDFLLMMFLGMAFVKSGVLTAERSTGFYWKLAAAGYIPGFTLEGVQLAILLRGWFDIPSMTWATAFQEVGRIGVCLGHMSVFLLFFKYGVLTRLKSVLAAVGQMALTNYLMQSAFCTLVFNFLKLHGQLERYQLYWVAGGIWVAELVWSPLWLRRFRFGPAEWCWRSLTYWKRQKMRVEAPETAPPALEPAGAA